MATSNELEARSTILSLPPEIIDAIASQDGLYDSDLGSCSLVCKAFLARFQPLLFRDVYLDQDNSERFSNQLVKKPEIGGYVRHALFHFKIFEQDWDRRFSEVARRLTHLRRFDMCTGKLQAKTWQELGGTFREGLRSILTSPTLISIQLTGNIVFAVPPRLLFASSAIREVTVSPADETPRDFDYWAKLDADIETPVEAEEPHHTSRCAKLYLSSYTNTADKCNWLPYVVSNHLNYLSHLTELTTHRISQAQLSSLQTVLHFLGGKIQRLTVCFHFTDDFHFDLSRNPGLQNLSLSYAKEYPFPYDGLAIIQNTLSGLSAPSLDDLTVSLAWRCPGPALQHDPPQVSLRELDNCFVRLGNRHSRLKSLGLTVFFVHRMDEFEHCHTWNQFDGVDVKSCLPLLGYHQPHDRASGVGHSGLQLIVLTKPMIV